MDNFITIPIDPFTWSHGHRGIETHKNIHSEKEPIFVQIQLLISNGNRTKDKASLKVDTRANKSKQLPSRNYSILYYIEDIETIGNLKSYVYRK